MPIFYDIADKVSKCQTHSSFPRLTSFQLVDVLGREANEQTEKTGRSVLDMSEWMSRIALETVGQAVLGYSFDPLDSPQNNPYTSAIKELMYASRVFRL